MNNTTATETRTANLWNIDGQDAKEALEWGKYTGTLCGWKLRTNECSLEVAEGGIRGRADVDIVVTRDGFVTWSVKLSRY